MTDVKRDPGHGSAVLPNDHPKPGDPTKPGAPSGEHRPGGRRRDDKDQAPIGPIIKPPVDEIVDPTPPLPPDDNDALYRISQQRYANTLYRWRDLERKQDGGGRKVVIDAIEARLRIVQGPPIMP